MSIYIKFLGLALLLVSSLATVKRYREYTAKRISEEESFVALLVFIKGRINRYLTPIPEIVKEFSDEQLSRVGFLEEVSSGKSISAAFESIADKLSLGKEFKVCLQNLFSTLGVGYKEEVLASIEETVEDLEKILEKEKEILPKDVKVFSSVLVAGVLGVFIFLV